MKATVNRQKLDAAVTLALGATDPRNIRPILQDICFHATDDGLELTATDLEVGVRIVVKEGIQVLEPGLIALLGAEIASIVHESPDETLMIETDGTTCHIRGAGSEYHITTEDVQEFPGVPQAPEKEAIVVDAALLAEMIRKTKFAAANEPLRYALNGVLFVCKKEDKNIEMVGADGRRMAVIKRKAESESGTDGRHILSLKCLGQMEKIVSGRSGAVKLLFTERQVWLSTDDVTLAGLLVEGHYPNYEEVIPDDCDKKAVISRGLLESAVRRAAVVSTEASHGIDFCFAPKQLVLAAESAERGRARVEIEIGYDGPAVTVRLNPDFVLDMLKVADDDSIVFEFKEASRPALLRAGRNYQYLTMPITEAAA